MKYANYLALLATLTVLLPLGALARDKNEHSVNIAESLQVGSTQLKPGKYQVEWQEAGPAVRVTFMLHGKTVATASATLKTNQSQVTHDDVVFQRMGNNKGLLKEIDFSRHKEALVFG